MERLNYHLFQSLATQFEVALVGPRGCQHHVSDIPVVDIATSPVPVFILSSTYQACKLACQWKPHLIIAGSGVAALPASIAAKQASIPLLTLVHGLDIIYPSVVYQYGFVPAIRGSDWVLANSENTKRLAIAAGVREEHIVILHPGVSMPRLSNIDSSAAQKLEASAKILISVGRLVRRKGITAFIRHSLPAIVRQQPQVVYWVAGEASDFSSGLKGTIKAEIERAISDTGLQDHVVLLGRVTDDQLADIYAQADVHIFPILDLPGDVEGFGMVAVEAAAYGVSTVAFDVGGVADAVDNGVSGVLVKLGDYRAFSASVQEILMISRDAAVMEQCIQFAQLFSWDHYGTGLNKLCTQILTASDSE